MALPEVDPLLSLAPETWRALGLRLQTVGLDAATAAPFTGMARGDPLRSPMAKWHLRRVREPSAYAMRIFMFWDAVTPDEARAALGDGISMEAMIEVGLLRRTDEGGVVSPFVMKMADEGRLYVFCDDAEPGGDAVMGPSEASLKLASLARPRVQVARALDVGCGPGTVALTMATMCDHVLATDINLRAIVLAQVNALVNGVDNVEFRRGDLFGPVGGDSFDVVASQPPFVPHPPDVSPTVFLFGGHRGDELALRVLREVPPHLAPGGLAALMVAWPILDGAPPLAERLREAIGASTDLSLLIMQTVPADESSINATCTAYARIRNGADNEGYERDVLRFRDHVERCKIRSIVDTFAFVRRSRGEDLGWTALVPVHDLGATSATRMSVDLLLAAGDRAFRSASRQADLPDRRMVSLDLKAAVPIRSALAMAEVLSATGHANEALHLYSDVRKHQPSWRSALLGAARIEIALGRAEAWRSRLGPLADQGDREARRLLGDIHWRRAELDAAFDRYAIESRIPAAAPSPTAPLIQGKVRVARRAAEPRPFLVWITCPRFEGSVAAAGLRLERERLWDLAVNCFAPSDEPVDTRVEYVIQGGVSKLSSVKAAALAHPGLFDDYRAVLLLDDDIGIDHEAVETFFWLMSRFQLDLAHPSLSVGSQSPCLPMFHQHESALRFTNTVDVRAPAFSRAGLITCIDSFDQSVSGDGLGQVWPHLLRDRPHCVGVVDAVTVSHLRPIDPISGSFYQHLKALGVDSTQEMHDVHQRYGCWFVYPRTVGDVDLLGRERHYPK